MFILEDRDNMMFFGPFKTKGDAKTYAKLNDWGPEDGDGSRFGGLGWQVHDLEKPYGDESKTPLYELQLIKD